MSQHRGRSREGYRAGGGQLLEIAIVALGSFAALGAIAYAAVRGHSTEHRPGASRPEVVHVSESLRPAPAAKVRRAPAPLLGRHPDPIEAKAEARFGFSGRRGERRFQCRLDSARWRRCRSPRTYTGLALGSHSFSVRALVGRRAGRASRFSWRIVESKPFSIAPQSADLGALFPGASPLTLPVVVQNPNQAPIFITSLEVSVTAEPPGCSSAENLSLTPAGVSAAAPLEVPAGASVRLPDQLHSAPAIALRDLPVNQDACQGAKFPLAFSGAAHG